MKPTWFFYKKNPIVGFYLDLRISALDSSPPNKWNFNDHYLNLLYRSAALMFGAFHAVAGPLRPAQNFKRRRPPKCETSAAKSRPKEKTGDRTQLILNWLRRPWRMDL
jgi:hypothetical protein